MRNKIANSKIFYAVLALACAVGVWLYVDVVQAPDTTVTVENIPITFVGEDMLADEGLMITEGHSTTVTITFSGPRTAVSQLDKSNTSIVVQAASQITGEGTYNLTYSVNYPSTVDSSQITPVKRSVSAIAVTVVQMTTKNVDIVGRFTGSAVSGVLFDENNFQFEESTVTVTGERSKVEQVDHAEVVLSEENLSATWSGYLDITLVDEQGNAIEYNDEDDLTCNITSVYTTFPVQMVKEVPLTVSFQAGGGATENDVSCTVNPSTILISGSEEQLAKVDSINLGTVDLADVVTSDVFTFAINAPTGITIPSGMTTASVTVSVSGLDTKKFTTSNIEVINVPEGYNVELVTQSLEVRVRGAAETLALIVDSDIHVTVDFSDIENSATGIRTMDAKVSVRGFADVGCVGDYTVVANVTRS
jgi:YbbR domain-containing protein